MKAVATANIALVVSADTNVLRRPSLSPREPHTSPPIIIPKKDIAAWKKKRKKEILITLAAIFFLHKFKFIRENLYSHKL